MPYLDETGLAYYNEKLQPWIASQPVKTIPSSLYPWTLTEKAGAVTCWPVGGTELLPTVDFMFTEVPPASGDKGPENPSTITGVSSVNALSFEQDLYNPTDLSYEMWDEYQLLSDGCIQFDAENNGSSALYRGYYTNPISGSYGNDDLTLVLDLKSFSASGNSSFARINLASGDDSRFQFYANINIGYSNNETYKTTPGIYTLPLKLIANSTKQYFLRTIATIAPGYSIHTKYRLIVAKTSSLRSYATPLGSTYYGGEIDLATGVMKVSHVAVTPDASTVDISSAPAALPLDYADTYGRTITSADGTSLVVGSTGGTVVYKLANPTTVQLSPLQISALAQTDKYTPRLNTIYTDASDVQVGYIKSPIREEYELQQAIVGLGGNI